MAAWRDESDKSNGAATLRQAKSAPAKSSVGPRGGFANTIQDLIVTGFGIVTSGLTALILALVESKFGLALYSFMWWFVIPVGALLSGFAAAKGSSLKRRDAS